MINFSEIREIPDSRRLFALVALALAVWTAAGVLMYRTANINVSLNESLESGDRIINAASVYRSYPKRGTDQPRPVEKDPMSVITGVVQALGMGERMSIRSDQSRISVQLDRLYGNELKDLLTTMESRGLRVSMAEIKALPSGGERLLGISLQMESN
ncbi:MAG: hypothetical protein LBI74_03370 [Synergistaceae bacterium]|jgi:hypothetical protein|nr:hypothetical protein [Synergistaceae bacterium]